MDFDHENQINIPMKVSRSFVAFHKVYGMQVGLI